VAKKPNYDFEKRRKELDRKKEEGRQARRAPPATSGRSVRRARCKWKAPLLLNYEQADGVAE
jgi:hypothetical protein